MDEAMLGPMGSNLFWRRFFARAVDAVIVFFVIDFFLFSLHRPLFEYMIRFLIDALGIRVRRNEPSISIFLFFVLMGIVFFEVALVYFFLQWLVVVPLWTEHREKGGKNPHPG